MSGYSKFHFQRMFKNYTGQTLANYLRQARLNKAKFLLSFTNETISNIAYNSGFSHIESFSRAFNKEFELSLSAFRDKSKKEIIKDELYYEEIFMNDLNLAITFSQNNAKFLEAHRVFSVERIETLANDAKSKMRQLAVLVIMIISTKVRST
ncbi:helix-turn-helix transcriptional regulator [Campylobacter iguaniorum]|uniref:helix-turn-helix transcriptional regulator n=1 Tax=Campylobacter iguaniorum TaxID=1244531 RepID=UPI00210F7BCF|nr:helix-turn-helix domain-containing protein [Campylobacter iguaniorum]